jgi:ribonuclease VapC
VILDSSVLVAIALDEPERAALIAKIDSAETVAVAAPTIVEAGIVLSARIGEDANELLADLLNALDAVVIEFGAGHWQTALSAWLRFGKSRHQAALNLGDCLAYAAAQVAREPLLAKGDDFPRTDLELA